MGARRLQNSIKHLKKHGPVPAVFCSGWPNLKSKNRKHDVAAAGLPVTNFGLFLPSMDVRDLSILAAMSALDLCSIHHIRTHGLGGLYPKLRKPASI